MLTATRNSNSLLLTRTDKTENFLTQFVIIEGSVTIIEIFCSGNNVICIINQ